MAEVTEKDVIGQRGRIIGDHPWAGHTGEIVRIEKTLVGWGAVVRLDDRHDVPYGQECFIFDGQKHWQRTYVIRRSTRQTRRCRR